MKLTAIRLPVMALVAVGVAASAAWAADAWETYTHADAKLEFQLPKDWKVESEDDLLTAENKAGDLGVMFFVADGSDAQKFFKEMASELGKFIQDAEVGKGPKEEKVNGLTQVFVEGSGKVDGEKIDFNLTFVVGGAKPMVALAIGKIEASQKTIDKVYQSIKKAK